MTVDEQLSADLAELARDGRRDPGSFEGVLSAVDTAAEGGLALAPLARVYAARVARAGAGTAIVATSLVMLVAMGCAQLVGERAFDFVAHPVLVVLAVLVTIDSHSLAIVLVAAALSAAAVARRIAAARFERALALGGADALLRDSDTWSVAATIAGVTSLVVVWVNIGYAGYRGSLWPVWDPAVWYAVASPIPLALAGVAIARAARRGRPRRWLLALAHVGILPVAVVALGVAFDVRASFASDDGALPLAIDLATRVVATLAFLAAATWLALRRRRSEHAVRLPARAPRPEGGQRGDQV